MMDVVVSGRPYLLIDRLPLPVLGLAKPQHQREGMPKLYERRAAAQQTGIWLNDEVINYYFRHTLTNRDEKQCLLTDEDGGRQCFYNTFFIQKLFDQKNSNLILRNKYNYKPTATWGRKFAPGNDIFKLTRLFIPYNSDNVH